MDTLMYVFPALIIVALVAVLVCKLNGEAQATTNPAQTVTMNSKYNGVRKDIVIKDFGSKKLEVIKYVREVAGYDLKEAKNAIEIREMIKALPIEVAEALISNFNNIGVSAELK